VHCRECAEDLRRKGLGPLQAKRRTPPHVAYSNLQLKEICWEQAEKDVVYYLERFKRFRVYDGVTPSDLDRITDEDRQLANKIAARISAKIWTQITSTDDSIARIGDWDLLGMNYPEWQRRKEIIRDVISIPLSKRGIGVARLTKALHQKRPRLMPICDSVLEDALVVCFVDKADRIIACMDRLRVIGQKHISRLQNLQELSKQTKAEMTALRILELLYWVQFGPFRRANRKD
jgi:hypothetical protein